MIKAYLSINNNEEVMLLPVPLSHDGFRVSSPWKNQQDAGLRQELNLIGLRGLRKVQIISFFPARDYPFLINRSMYGKEYVDTIERWRDRRFPLRLVVVDSEGIKSLNMAVTIDEFDWEFERNGDIHFSLDMTEFVFVDLRR